MNNLQPAPDLWRSTGGTDTVLFDMAAGLGVRNVLGVGDPDVHVVDGRWTMYLGGFTTGFTVRLFEARLPAGDELDSDRWALRTAPGRPRVAQPLFSPPRLGAFDSHGTHTPAYATGRRPDGTEVERIYYAGRSSLRSDGRRSRYSVGVAERRAGRWVRRPQPVVTGDRSRPSAFEPMVRFHDGRWRMWYLCAPGEVGRGEQPDYEIRCVHSADGLTGWSAPTTTFSTSEGFFDGSMRIGPDGAELLLARGSNLYGTSPYPPQGIWWLRSDTPSAERDEWTATPVPVLDADVDPPWWLGLGAFGPDLHWGRREHDHATMYVFTSGTSRAAPWWPVARSRLRSRRLPPPPVPYALTVGRLTLPDARGVAR